MKIAITGWAGYIGAFLVARHLERGDSIRLLTRGIDPQHRSMPGGSLGYAFAAGIVREGYRCPSPLRRQD
jgi:nucleoside-diphosphate-sugar epimerase